MTVIMTEFPTENDWAQVKRRALKTCGKKPVTPPTTEWKHAILNARHSPIRRLFFSFDLDDVPYWLSNELCRHHEGVEKYVFSQRNDRQKNYDRNKAPQDAPVNLVFDCNAEGLMTVMNKRLCNQASAEMRVLMGKIKEIVLHRFPEFTGLLVPMCEYCGGVCHEMNPCGYANSMFTRLWSDNTLLIQENEMLKATIEGMKR